MKIGIVGIFAGAILAPVNFMVKSILIFCKKLSKKVNWAAKLVSVICKIVLRRFFLSDALIADLNWKLLAAQVEAGCWSCFFGGFIHLEIGGDWLAPFIYLI